jgi:hypothetical protein
MAVMLLRDGGPRQRCANGAEGCGAKGGAA